MRFTAPPRHAVRPEVLSHPAFATLRHADLLHGAAWPDCATLNARLDGARHTVTGRLLRFAAQTPALLSDRLDYEQRIFDLGTIATRASNWHDLINALVWLTRTDLKSAVNKAFVSWAAPAPGGGRSRAQSALTHFDEAGALVVLPSRLLDAWDAHDWTELFHRQRARWGNDAQVLLYGHALLEHLLVPEVLPVAKCIAVTGASTLADAVDEIAAAIRAGRILRDPQELRPLPLAGLPGWHPDGEDAAFYRTAPCFRPLRSGRLYPRWR